MKVSSFFSSLQSEDMVIYFFFKGADDTDNILPQVDPEKASPHHTSNNLMKNKNKQLFFFRK